MQSITIENDNELYLKWVDDEIGWGVFTKNKIQTGQPIEYCYYYPICTKLPEYDIFVFNVNKQKCFLFGYGCIYNHSYNPNGEWKLLDIEKHIIGLFAIKDIEPHEQIFHNYGAYYWMHKSRIGMQKNII